MDYAQNKYFLPGKISFWRWEDNLEVVAGLGKHTICYRTDLINLLRETAPNGVPGLSNVLLCLSACHEGSSSQNLCERSLALMQETPLQASGRNSETFRMLSGYVDAAKRVMKLIRGLGIDWRSGSGRVLLLNELFADSVNKIPHQGAIQIIDLFAGGSQDYLLVREGIEEMDYWFYQDITDLLNICNRYPDSAALERKLRSGIITLPEKLDIEIPERAENDKTLFEQLAEDQRTAGLAMLTQNLIALLNIPIHAANPSDHLYGGISDISNRGSFDKMLLSELANDDLGLMARLVNNEVLYLRREAPPVNVNHQRNILVDTTIKMWGMPRIFSIAAALACTHNHHHVDSVSAFAFGGEDYQEIDLAHMDGVINAMTKMDPALHSCFALLSFIEEHGTAGNTENIFITGEDTLNHPVYYRYQSEIQHALNFLIEVNRNGDLTLYEFINGHRKIINTGKFDLDELLTAKSSGLKKEIASGAVPCFYNLEAYPLYFPTMRMQVSDGNIFSAGRTGLVGINDQQRVLYWSDQGKGALQIMDKVEIGVYCFGTPGDGTGFLLVHNNHGYMVKIYHINLKSGVYDVAEFTKQFGAITGAAYNAGSFYLAAEDGAFICIDARSGLVSSQVISEQTYNVHAAEYNIAYKNPRGARRFINNGYAVMQRLNTVGITVDGKVNINDHNLELRHGKYLELISGCIALRMGTMRVLEFDGASLPHVRFTKAVWADGSELVIDTNGFLHLRSSDASIPEITLPCILDKPTAAWSADENYCGSLYFHTQNLRHKPVMPTEEFFKIYIQSFADRIMRSCA